MKTLFLPGYSPNNRSWMEQTINDLPQINFQPIIWSHWETGISDQNNFTPEFELSSILPHAIGPTNILSKSIGTLVAAHLMTNDLIQINKLILCGIPLNALSSQQKSLYKILANFPTDNLLVIHNKDDVVGSAESVKDFLFGINPSIEVIVKPQSDHNYPYSKEFGDFLNN